MSQEPVLFSELNLNKPLLNALEDAGFVHPTTIQHQVFSVVMSGKDVIGIAQTGTGKTLAYLLPMLRQWQFTKERNPTMLVLVPTRELVVQVEEECKRLCAYMNVRIAGVYGGVNLKQHIALVEQGLDIIIATPGRLMDLVLNGALRLKNIKKLVIDEVDELLNLGFLPQLLTIFEALPDRRQNIMFSATLSEEVEQLITNFFLEPLRVEATPIGTPHQNINQSCFIIPNFLSKLSLLQEVIALNETMNKVLVFAESRAAADMIFEETEQAFGERIGVIHSNKSQNNRFATVDKFKSGDIRILIATDVIARGIDVADVSHVINFDVPASPELYMHRIGRTGRADKRGDAITFVAPYEMESWEAIEAFMNMKVAQESVPDSVRITDQLLPDERMSTVMPNLEVKNPRKIDSSGAFHEKKAKNLKVNMHMTRGEKMKLKYGKPKKRRNN